ncbi:MAG: radical SAM/SPASM domain-containing protein [Endomicrobiaceae bacterium]|jgi:MoaA/NifB/PqqE/SkfB family radical SAM enzyme|nr:radical SAM/SPASM domain-containing protein [Endomicrobiaceae bacterium]MDD3730648.1 radical SAM/SPASM domain-containing protein [Endomicrobiaceae bacterium]MDD4166685.1 radical SAM/SPASM domain-containing protein [Endomicrobiaceae bacterium]
MYKTIEKSKKSLKAGDAEGALRNLYVFLGKEPKTGAKIPIYEEIAKMHVFMKNYTKAIEEIDVFFNDTEMLSFLENIDEYITESNKDRVKNTLLNNFEILKKRTILKSKPSSMLVELTNKCNLRCIMCRTNKSDISLSADIVSDIAANIKYFEKITCLGGEVFLCPEFSYLLKQAKKSDTEMCVSTNGLLLLENLAMFENMKASIGVSVDGFDKNTYEKIRLNGRFEVLLENVAALKTALQKESFKEVKSFLYMIVMKENYFQIRQAFDFAVKNGFCVLKFLKLNGEPQNSSRLSQTESNEAAKNINACMDIIEKEHLNIKILTDPDLNVVRKNQKNLYNNKSINRSAFGVKCDVPWKNISVSINNDIFFDCCSDRKEIGHFETVEKSWNSLAIQKIRQAVIDGVYIEPCNKCSQLV